MAFDFSKDYEVKVRMQSCINDVATIYTDPREKDKVAETPALNSLFEIDPDSPTLDTTAKEKFDSLTARLLHLAKRVRPDIHTDCQCVPGYTRNNSSYRNN
jgi:hypothetical protein